MVVRRLPTDSELYHHGILGQRWGIRRYQNKDGTLTSAGRKHKGLIDQIRDNRRMKKVRRAKVEKAKQQQKEKDERYKRLQQASSERQERAKIIKTGNAKEISKFADKMSKKEMEEAITRINFKQTIDSYSSSQDQAKRDKIKNKIDSMANIALTVGSVAAKGAEVYGAFQKVGLVKQKDTKVSKLEAAKKVMELNRDISNLREEVAKKARNKDFNAEIEKLNNRNTKLDIENKILDNTYKRQQMDLVPAKLKNEYAKIGQEHRKQEAEIKSKELKNQLDELKLKNNDFKGLSDSEVEDKIMAILKKKDLI